MGVVTRHLPAHHVVPATLRHHRIRNVSPGRCRGGSLPGHGAGGGEPRQHQQRGPQPQPHQPHHPHRPQGMCFLLYTGGDEEKLSCMARAACESPVAADNYLAAAKLWYKMHKLIQAVPFNTKYTAIMETIYDASEHAKKGGECTKYSW